MTEVAVTLWVETGDGTTVAELDSRAYDQLKGRRGAKVASDIFDMTDLTVIGWDVVEVAHE